MVRASFLVAIFVVLAACANAFSPLAQQATRPVTALPVKIKISVGDGEPVESALRRFKREVNKSGHLMELRHKRYFENPQERQKRKVKEMRMRKKFERMQKRRMQQRV